MAREPRNDAAPGQADTAGSEAERLRHEIDRGRTNDKVDFPDPAAAPLGTDDEAANASTNAGAIEDERQRRRDLGESTSSFRDPEDEIADDPMRDGNVWAGSEKPVRDGLSPTLRILILAVGAALVLLLVLWLLGIM